MLSDLKSLGITRNRILPNTLGSLLMGKKFMSRIFLLFKIVNLLWSSNFSQLLSNFKFMFIWWKIMFYFEGPCSTFYDEDVCIKWQKKKKVEIQGLVESKYFKCCIFFKSLSHVYKILLETKESLPYTVPIHTNILMLKSWQRALFYVAFIYQDLLHKWINSCQIYIVNAS